MVSRSIRLLLALLIIGACSFPAPDALAAAAGAAGAAITNSIADLTNVERSRVGASPLRVENRLMKAAQLQAEEMASLGRMDHVLADGVGKGADRLGAARGLRVGVDAHTAEVESEASFDVRPRRRIEWLRQQCEIAEI